MIKALGAVYSDKQNNGLSAGPEVKPLSAIPVNNYCTHFITT